MKKIAILTWLHNGNFGTALQAYALQRVISEQGYEVENMNYCASPFIKLRNWIENRNSPQLLIGKILALKKRKEFKYHELMRDTKYSKFKDNYMNLSRLCKSPNELKQLATRYDLFICGSDQIWSPALMNPVYYFSFLPSSCKRIAYAPSFGVTDTTNRKKKQIRNYIGKFDYISIREVEGQKLIKELSGKDVPVCVDPTMLLEVMQWDQIINEPIVMGKYIFCYFLTKNLSYIESVRKISEKVGLKVVIVPTPKGPFETGFVEKLDVGPNEWLNLIRYASYVCTDSFHGCLFAALFHIEFYVYKRFSDSNKKSENSRIYSLTALLGTEDRIIGEDDTGTEMSKTALDYNVIDRNVEKAREQSSKWLFNAIYDEVGDGI